MLTSHPIVQRLAPSPRPARWVLSACAGALLAGAFAPLGVWFLLPELLFMASLLTAMLLGLTAARLTTQERQTDSFQLLRLTPDGVRGALRGYAAAAVIRSMLPLAVTLGVYGGALVGLAWEYINRVRALFVTNCGWQVPPHTLLTCQSTPPAVDAVGVLHAGLAVAPIALGGLSLAVLALGGGLFIGLSDLQPATLITAGSVTLLGVSMVIISQGYYTRIMSPSFSGGLALLWLLPFAAPLIIMWVGAAGIWWRLLRLS